MWTVRRHDRVKVLWGKDKGKEGEIIAVDRANRRVIVSKVNLAKRHTRAQGQKDVGGIKDKELWLPVCKVMLICPETKKPTRPKIDRLMDGTKIRVDRASGSTIPEPKKK